MERFKKLVRTNPTALIRKTDVKHYDKKFKEQVIKTIADCRTIGLTWEEIKHELNCMYALNGDISTFRKEYQALANKGQIPGVKKSSW